MAQKFERKCWKEEFQHKRERETVTGAQSECIMCMHEILKEKIKQHFTQEISHEHKIWYTKKNTHEHQENDILVVYKELVWSWENWRETVNIRQGLRGDMHITYLETILWHVSELGFSFVCPNEMTHKSNRKIPIIW